jgi:nucleotide-binding universal stress UspA family protein
VAITPYLCPHNPPKSYFMKKILVPTDFSENALKALKYAVNLANKTDSSIIVLNTYQLNYGAGQLLSIDNILQEDREEQMKALLQSIHPLLNKNLKIESYIEKGNTVEIISKIADYLKIDLILMGTTGAGGMKKMFMGSTAGHVIKNAEIPVLAIPSEYSEKAIKKITLALDSKQLKSNSVLTPLLELLKVHKANLNLLIIANDDNDTVGIDADLLLYLEQLGIRFSYSKISSNSVTEGIIEFVRNKKSSLLCLIHHNRGWFENIFHRSISENMAFESHIPLLVLRG